MKRLIAFLTVVITFNIPALSTADEQPATLAKSLEPFRPFVGKTWKGELTNSTPEKPVQDIMKWERALNGQAVRILHSINSGEYGGESIIVWNPKTERIEFHYFTTAGFMTHGIVTFENGKIITSEEVIGNQNGVTATKAVMEILPNGRLHTKSRYLTKGQWADGHEATYEESPGAQVVFK